MKAKPVYIPAETEKKRLAYRGIEPTAELVNHCLSTWL